MLNLEVLLLELNDIEYHTKRLQGSITETGALFHEKEIEALNKELRELKESFTI